MFRPFHSVPLEILNKNVVRTIRNYELSATRNLTRTPISTVQGQMRRLDLTSNKITPRQYMTLVQAVEDLALVGVVVF